MLAVCIWNLGGCTEKNEADAASTENTESSTIEDEVESKSEVDNTEGKKEERGSVVNTEKINQPQNEVEHKSYTVKEGDWLMNIAREVCGDSKLIYEIYEMNQETISNPDFIYPGQILILPNN